MNVAIVVARWCCCDCAGLKYIWLSEQSRWPRQTQSIRRRQRALAEWWWYFCLRCWMTQLVRILLFFFLFAFQFDMISEFNLVFPRRRRRWKNVGGLSTSSIVMRKSERTDSSHISMRFAKAAARNEQLWNINECHFITIFPFFVSSSHIRCSNAENRIKRNK